MPDKARMLQRQLDLMALHPLTLKLNMELQILLKLPLFIMCSRIQRFCFILTAA